MTLDVAIHLRVATTPVTTLKVEQRQGIETPSSTSARRLDRPRIALSIAPSAQIAATRRVALVRAVN